MRPETKNIILIHQWIEKHPIESFGFTPRTPVYEIFEVVYMRFATLLKCNWKDIHNAALHQHTFFAARAMCIALIDKALHIYKGIGITQANALLGQENLEFVIWFHEKVSFIQD